MSISDIIEAFILESIREGNTNIAELQRNELASRFNCVPSQINYVISTRFTPERGYEVESRRGGGGYIKIRKIYVNKSDYLMHIVNSMENSLTYDTAKAYITNFLDYEKITEREARLMLAAISDRSLMIKGPAKDIVRASILKNMLIGLV